MYQTDIFLLSNHSWSEGGVSQVNNDPCGMCYKDLQILVTDEMGNGNKKDRSWMTPSFPAWVTGGWVKINQDRKGKGSNRFKEKDDMLNFKYL